MYVTHQTKFTGLVLQVANVLYCDTVVSEFELQPHYYVHFRVNTIEKGMNSLIFPAMDWIV